MKLRIPGLAAAAAALLALSASAFAQWNVDGRWYGVGHERPIRQGVASEYTISISLAGTGGTIDYPSLRCGGSLTRISGNSTRAVFRERIGYGTCIDGGEVTLSLVNGNRLSFTWLGTDGGTPLSVVGLLNRD